MKTFGIIFLVLMGLSANAQLKSYGGVGVGVAKTRIQCPDGDCDQSSVGFKIFAGANYNDRIIGELSYFDFGKSNGQGNFANGSSYSASIHTRMIGITAGHPFALVPRFTLVPSLGFGVSLASLKYPDYSSQNLTKTSLVYLCGVAVHYVLTPKIDLRLQGDLTQTKVHDSRGNVGMLSVGAAFKYQ